jgi:hypothetical protein
MGPRCEVIARRSARALKETGAARARVGGYGGSLVGAWSAHGRQERKPPTNADIGGFTKHGIDITILFYSCPDQCHRGLARDS